MANRTNPNSTVNCFTYATAHGPLTIYATDKGVCAVDFAAAEPGKGTVYRATALTNAAANQMQEYLAGKRRAFDVPLDIQGTAFQRLVWTETSSIPYGQTATAAQIAEAIGKPGAHRSVGTAVRQNRLAPLIPTHRIANPAAADKRARLFRALCAMEADRS